MPLVLVRTPTYRRPDLLRRALHCLQAQTHQEWICEIRDDCPEGSARSVVEDLADPRIRHVPNERQKFLVKNLDDCFLRDNPYGADYFYMLEDDNQVLPDFLARGCDILGQTGLGICQINQLIEHRDDPQNAYIGNHGIFDDIYDERVHQPHELRLALLGGVGISNGAVFWSKNIRRELAFKTDTIPALDEPIRTLMTEEPVYISREPLAIWAKSESSTSRNLGLKNSQIRREMDLKKSLSQIRCSVWAQTPVDMRDAFMEGGIIRLPLMHRLKAMKQAGILIPDIDLGLRKQARRLAVRWFGKTHPSLQQFI